MKTAWNSIRKEAGVSCRLHDLRHTALTKMAEAGVPESTTGAGRPHVQGDAGALLPHPDGSEARCGGVLIHNAEAAAIPKVGRGYYRPQQDCIMFTRDEVGFCAVCRRAIERVIRMYAK
jgi:hypothetical protein